MEPRIQYAKTKDGVRIAFATYGDGEPIVSETGHFASHVQLEWEQPLTQASISRLVAERRMVIRFDPRGVGLSDRDVDDLSLDAWLLDMEAVVDHLSLNRFALIAGDLRGMMAMGYAVRHPERVTHLVLLNCYARGAAVAATPRGRAFLGLVDDFEMWSENVGAAVFGFGREETRNYGEFVRACVDPEMVRRFNELRAATDVTGLLSQITTPTLVVSHAGLEFLPMDTTRELASEIPNARLLSIEGSYTDNVEQLFSGVTEFLREDEEEAAAGAEPLAKDDIHTILFTDVEGSTALTQRLGDAKARDLLREHERMVREALKAHGGSEVKTMGDGFMTSFSSATKALECAIAMQRAFAQHNESAGEPIKVRIGLNAGEPIAEDDDLFGTAVNEAARITATAKGGEILASDVVRQLAKGKDFFFSDRGETSLKGFDEPVRLYEVRWEKA